MTQNIFLLFWSQISSRALAEVVKILSPEKIFLFVAMFVANSVFPDVASNLLLSPASLLFFVVLAGGSGGGSSSGSTPYLCTWDGEKFKYENDILFGKPNNFFEEEKEGKRMYERGITHGDLYRIKNTFRSKEGKFLFQIREVEPEESFIDYLSLLQVVYPKTHELIVDTSYEKFWLFNRASLIKKAGIEDQQIYNDDKKNITKKLSYFDAPEHDAHEMKTGDKLYVEAHVKQADDLFLFLGSYWRDWVPGRVSYKQVTPPFSGEISHGTFFWRAVKTTGVLVVFGVMWIFATVSDVVQGFHGGRASNSSRPTFGWLNEVHADVVSSAALESGEGEGGHSFVLEGLVNGSYQKIDVISPRDYQTSMSVTRIPKEAIQKGGKVMLRFSATKRHRVTSLFLASPEQSSEYKIEMHRLGKAYHNREMKDYTKTLNQKRSGEYLHIIPGDKVDVEFKEIITQKRSDQEEAYLIQARGYYTSLSREGEKKAGKWVEKVDPEAREKLKYKYPLMSYRNEDNSLFV